MKLRVPEQSQRLSSPEEEAWQGWRAVGSQHRRKSAPSFYYEIILTPTCGSTRNAES